MEFEFEEQETYNFDEVQAIVSDLKGKSVQMLGVKDAELTTALEGQERLKELEEGNHLLQIKNLAITNGISDDLFDLIVDSDLEVVKSKIDKLKSITKEKEIDNSFKPESNRSEDAYTKAESNNDVRGMLSQKVSRIFG